MREIAKALEYSNRQMPRRHRGDSSPEEFDQSHYDASSVIVWRLNTDQQKTDALRPAPAALASENRML